MFGPSEESRKEEAKVVSDELLRSDAVVSDTLAKHDAERKESIDRITFLMVVTLWFLMLELLVIIIMGVRILFWIGSWCNVSCFGT